MVRGKKVRGLKAALFGGVLTLMATTAVGMTVAGAEADAALLVAGGLGVVAGEIAVRLYRDDDGPDSSTGPDEPGGADRLAIA
jgi:hypothetical protein